MIIKFSFEGGVATLCSGLVGRTPARLTGVTKPLSCQNNNSHIFQQFMIEQRVWCHRLIRQYERQSRSFIDAEFALDDENLRLFCDNLFIQFE
jgi:hypothetical protein